MPITMAGPEAQAWIGLSPSCCGRTQSGHTPNAVPLAPGVADPQPPSSGDCWQTGRDGKSPQGRDEWGGRAGSWARVGCNKALCPTEMLVLLVLQPGLRLGQRATQGRTFGEAVLRLLVVLAEVGDLLQEVSGVGHVCRAPLRVTVLMGLWAGVWGRVGKNMSVGMEQPPVSSPESGGAWGSWRGGAQTTLHGTTRKPEPRMNENLPQRSKGPAGAELRLDLGASGSVVLFCWGRGQGCRDGKASGKILGIRHLSSWEQNR